MIAVASTADGVFAVDLEDETVGPWPEAPVPPASPALNLPRVIAAAAVGSTVVALVDARPPLLVSHDAGSTWRDAGRGLPPGQAIAIAESDPDLIVYAARNRIYLSRNGGVFWSALAVELPAIEALALSEG